MQNIIIGHRGAAGYAPENTMISFQKAQELQCQMIEFDVRLSVDGEAFIFHDDTLKRTTNGRGVFCQATAAYLKTLDAGSWYARACSDATIPTLKETLLWVCKQEIQANVELKAHPQMMEQTVTTVLSEIGRYWSKDKPLPLVSSFQYDMLTLCHQLSPELPLGLLLDEWHDEWLTLAKQINCISVHLSRTIATKARVSAIQQQGYRVFVYTVNRRALALKLFKWGVDGIFSDYPDLITRRRLIDRLRCLGQLKT